MSLFQHIFKSKELIKVAPTPHLTPIENELKSIRTLIMVDYFDNEYGDKQQIDKILAACKLTPNDYLVTAIQIPFNILTQYEQIQEIIIFGSSLSSLGINYNIPYNYFTKINNKYLLNLPRLNSVMLNPNLKGKLWNNALKPHFL